MRHIHNAHGPKGRGELSSELKHRPPSLYAFSLVVCIHNDHILLVQERSNSGYWLPGGRVDPGETLCQASIRETIEEAGVEPTLTGVLKVQYTAHKAHVRLRAIFMGKPKDGALFPLCKTMPDYESCGAVWVSLKAVMKRNLPMRGSEPYTWVKYLEEGGKIHSLDVLSDFER